MGYPFTDITLYTETAGAVGTPEYTEQVSLQNFVSDFYVQCMNGYKPPKTSRITIQPAFHNIWNQSWRNGSIVHTAPYFSLEKYLNLDRKGKMKYTLDIIQTETIKLSTEYGWNKSIFDIAYKTVLENDFSFKIDYPKKISRDKKKTAGIILEKTETITSLYVEIKSGDTILKRKLFDKNNVWWYDCVYVLAQHNKWFDKSRFGIKYRKLEIWLSLEKDEVEYFEDGIKVKEIEFWKHFRLN